MFLRVLQGVDSTTVPSQSKPGNQTNVHEKKHFSPVKLAKGVCVCVILFVMPIVLLFTLWALFAELMSGKARAKMLEEDSRACRNCRHVYSLLAGTEAITQLLSWLTQWL